VDVGHTIETTYKKDLDTFKFNEETAKILTIARIYSIKHKEEFIVTAVDENGLKYEATHRNLVHRDCSMKSMSFKAIH